MRAWINHFFLNIGAALACVFYATVPPSLTGHSEEELKELSLTDPASAFWFGLCGKR